MAKRGRSDGNAPAAGSLDAGAVQALAERIRRGEISAAQAIEVLIDETVRRSGCSGGDAEAMGAKLRALLERQAGSDPFLSKRVRRIGDPA
jgi:hypothetical protein